MDLRPERLHQTTIDIVAGLARDSGLGAEVLRAQRQFFAGPPDYLPEGEAHAAAHGRFCEWFVLERESEHLGALPIDAIGGLPDPVREALRASSCGFYLVETSVPYVRVRDVVSDETFELQTDARLEVGDLVVGRIFPGDFDAMLPSPSSAILRQGTDVAAALQRDLQAAGIGRRLTQAELEAVLFRSVGELAVTQARRVPPERLEARLDSLLRDGGDRSYSAAEISEALEAASEGPGAVMGPVLETLAFESDVDLEALRATMLELWNEHRLRGMERGPAAPTAPAPAIGGQPLVPREPPRTPAKQPQTPVDADARGLGATIADRIERGLAQHEDIESLFADVEGMLGDEGEEEDDADEVTVGAGDLDGLVQEYLWERGLGADAPAASTLAAFVAHQTELPVPGVYLEAIPARELASFLLRAYLTGAPMQRAQVVRAHFASLADFYAWAEETQAYELEAALSECRSAIVEPIDRLQRASLALSSAPVAAERAPRVLRIQRVDGGEFEVVGTETEPTWIDAPEAAVDLRADDLLLAATTADGRGGMRLCGQVVVLPAAAADLLE